MRTTKENRVSVYFQRVSDFTLEIYFCQLHATTVLKWTSYSSRTTLIEINEKLVIHVHVIYQPGQRYIFSVCLISPILSFSLCPISGVRSVCEFFLGKIVT